MVDRSNLAHVLEECISTLQVCVESLVDDPELAAIAAPMQDILRRAVVLGETPDHQAFVIDEPRRQIVFSDELILRAALLGMRVAADVAPQDSLVERGLARAAITEVVVHELTHWIQGFPDFSQVPGIKAGVGADGLAMLDVAADAIASRIAAKAQGVSAAGLAGASEQQRYANALFLAYVLGTELFPAKQKRAKQQRHVGLLMAGTLAQADSLGAVDRSQLFGGWKPTQPLFAFKPGASSSFNALVLDSPPSVLILGTPTAPRAAVQELWQGIGSGPLGRQISRTTGLFISTGVINAEALLQRPVARRPALAKT